MLLDRLVVDAAAFEAGTGWAIMPEGACRGEVCVPVPADAIRGGSVDVEAVAEHMGLPLVHDEVHGLWALGPWTGNGRALTSAEAPELVLPDLHNEEFALSSLRGQKVLLLAWAPY